MISRNIKNIKNKYKIKYKNNVKIRYSKNIKNKSVRLLIRWVLVNLNSTSQNFEKKSSNDGNSN